MEFQNTENQFVSRVMFEMGRDLMESL